MAATQSNERQKGRSTAEGRGRQSFGSLADSSLPASRRSSIPPSHHKRHESCIPRHCFVSLRRRPTAPAASPRTRHHVTTGAPGSPSQPRRCVCPAWSIIPVRLFGLLSELHGRAAPPHRPVPAPARTHHAPSLLMAAYSRPRHGRHLAPRRLRARRAVVTPGSPSLLTR